MREAVCKWEWLAVPTVSLNSVLKFGSSVIVAVEAVENEMEPSIKSFGFVVVMLPELGDVVEAVGATLLVPSVKDDVAIPVYSKISMDCGLLSPVVDQEAVTVGVPTALLAKYPTAMMRPLVESVA